MMREYVGVFGVKTAPASTGIVKDSAQALPQVIGKIRDALRGRCCASGRARGYLAKHTIPVSSGPLPIGGCHLDHRQGPNGEEEMS